MIDVKIYKKGYRDTHKDKRLEYQRVYRARNKV